MQPPLPRSLVLGVLGGIASGKSAVARALAGPAGVVIDADRLAREELESEDVVARLLEAYGPEVLDAEGRPRRDWLAARVFAAPEERRRLEGWIHGNVRARIQAALADAEARGVPRIVLDVPLLLENDALHHLVSRCDALVFVDSSLEDRERRAQARRGWPLGEVARREASQLPLDRKRARADHVIANDGTLEDLDRAVQRVLAALERE